VCPSRDDGFMRCFLAPPARGSPGAYLSTIRGQQFVENMTEGRGFLGAGDRDFLGDGARRASSVRLCSSGSLSRPPPIRCNSRPHIEQATANCSNILPYALSIRRPGDCDGAFQSARGFGGKPM